MTFGKSKKTWKPLSRVNKKTTKNKVTKLGSLKTHLNSPSFFERLR